MWARIVEIGLGFWLMMSPFIFRYAEANRGGLANDLLCGLVVIIFGFASFWNRTHWAHFLLFIVAGWLIISAYMTGHPSPPHLQNRMIVGLLLGMFAIIPNDADKIPGGWKKFYVGKSERNQ